MKFLNVKSIPLGVCMLLSLYSIAQDDTIKAKVKDTTVYYVRATSTGSFNRTNDGNSFLTNNNIRFNVIKKTMSLNTSNSWIYGVQSIGLTNNDYSSSVDFNMFKPGRKLYYWALATYDKSFSLKINNRLQTGIGLGYVFVNTNDASISLSDGIIYEYNNLLPVPGSEKDSNYVAIRNSLRLKYRFEYKKIIVLDGIHFWQPSFADIQDYIIKSNSTLSVKVKSWLSITMAVVYNKLNVTNKENLLINYGFMFEKTF